MGKDEPIPEDALLEPLFEDLLKGQKSVYEIPLETVDAKAWIGKKAVNAQESNKPNAPQVIAEHPDGLSVRSNFSAQPTTQPMQPGSRALQNEESLDPEQAFDEWRRKAENEEAHQQSLKARVNNTFAVLLSEFYGLFGVLIVLVALAAASLVARHSP